MMKQIELTQNKLAIVDDEDYERLNQYKWHYDSGYAVRQIRIKNGRQTKVKMHWDVIGKPGPRFEVDHIDRNGLNNKKDNLRICSHAENSLNKTIHKDNSSGYKGVSWCKREEKWAAQIMFSGKKIHLGYFLNKKDAAIAYDEASKVCHGNFGNRNN